MTATKLTLIPQGRIEARYKSLGQGAHTYVGMSAPVARVVVTSALTGAWMGDVFETSVLDYNKLTNETIAQARAMLQEYKKTHG